MNKANKSQSKLEKKNKIDRKSSIKRQRQKDLANRRSSTGGGGRGHGGGGGGGGSEVDPYVDSRAERISENADDVRMLHEAYQFLMKKYVPSDNKKSSKKQDQDEAAVGDFGGNAVGMMMF